MKIILSHTTYFVWVLLKMKLDKYQKYSVDHIGSIAVDAKAGSGKTRCVESRVKRLLDDGVGPSKITVCSFTKKASKEIKERIAKSVSTDLANRVNTGTIHSLCYSIWTKYKRKTTLNYEKPNLINDGFKFIQIRTIIETNKFELKIGKFYNYLNEWQAYGLSPNEVLNGKVQTRELLEAQKTYKLFDTFLKNNNMFDFGSLLVWTKELLQDYDVVRRESSRIEHLFVDECFPAKHLVLKSNGHYIRIGDLYEKYKDYRILPEIVTLNEKTGKIQSSRIKRVFKNVGKKDMSKVSFKSGGSFMCSSNHVMKTEHEWKRVSELKVGEFIISKEVNRLRAPFLYLGDDHKSLVLAALIGTGTISKRKDKHVLEYMHSLDSKAYMLFKIGLWEKDRNPRDVIINTTKQLLYRSQYIQKYDIDYLLESYLTPMAIAIIVADNPLSAGNHIVLRNGNGVKDKEELYVKLNNQLEKQYGIKGEIVPINWGKSKRKNLVFDEENTKKICDLVAGYVPKIVEEKFPFLDYKKTPYKNSIENLTTDYGMDEIVSIENFPDKETNLYDLEIEEEHNANYFISGVFKSPHRGGYYYLAHNCHDINKVQFDIVEKLASKHKNIYLYFDFMQSIYGFQHSRIENLSGFIEKHNIHIHQMPNNYRSKKAIVDLGNKLIKAAKIPNMVEAIQKKDGNGKYYVITSPDENHEAHEVFNLIEERVSDFYSYKDIVIMYRTNSQSRALIDEAMSRDIPINVPSESSFYKRKELIDIINYLIIINDPYKAKIDNFKRVINKPKRYISGASINAVERYADSKGITFFNALRQVSNLDIKPNQQENISRFTDMIERVHKESINISMDKILNSIMNRLGYLNHIKDSTINNETVTVDDIVSGLESFFRNFINPRSAIAHYIKANKTKAVGNAVRFSTIHGFKGLEAPVCFIVGVSEGLLPHRRSTSHEDIEEEKRVMYVGVTRAVDELILSTINGKYGRFNAVPSRFLVTMGVNIPRLTNYN